MKKSIILLLLSLVCVIYSCGGGGKKNEIPVAGEAKLFAVVTNPDSTKRAAIVLRIIRKTIKTDSTKMRDEIIYDTVWAVEKEVATKDSLGKEIIDTATGKPKMIAGWFMISKDSVNTRVENIPLDSLLKK